MNRLFWLLLPLLVWSCTGKHTSNAPRVTTNQTVERNTDLEGDTIRMNLENSQIDWIATKMRGTRRKQGVILFKDGFLLSKNDQIVGGNFIVDMETIDVTSIPVHETAVRKNFLDHLKNDDFFNVSHYPISTLELMSVQKINNDSLRISGNLQIREVTRNIEFSAYHKDNIFRTSFTFNRFDWNIAYQGSWADKMLVDKDVELTIEITTE